MLAMTIMTVMTMPVMAVRVMAVMMRAMDISIRPQVAEQRCAEQSRNQGTQQWKEDDGVIHVWRQPFMSVMSSTAMVPRLRK